MKTQDEIRKELGEYFQDSVYWCERVPEAWSYGTMSLEDFVPAWEDDDILDSILEICEVPKVDLNDIREALDAREAKAND